jgi:hypothetical protein
LFSNENIKSELVNSSANVDEINKLKEELEKQRAKNNVSFFFFKY